MRKGLAQGGIKFGLGLGYFVLQFLQGGFVAGGAGFRQGFTPFHLLHQKGGIHAGVFGGIGIYALLFEQIGGAVGGVFEDGVGLV